MASRAAGPAVTFSAAKAPDIDTDFLFIPVFDKERISDDISGLDAATGGAVGRALTSGELQGRPFELLLTPLSAPWRARRLGLIGAGKIDEFTTDRLRRLATAAGLAARQRRALRVAFLHRGPTSPIESAQAIAEGLMLAVFSSDSYKTSDRNGQSPDQITVAATDAKESELAAAVERGRILGESCNIARDLCNEPSNVLTPRVLADRASEIARSAGLGVEILDEKEIERLRMGLLLGVAKGSHEPPRMLVLRHSPAGAPKAPVLGLVGKGITFDTGGISIKPAEGMERMKDDMSGGAAVICAMRAIALLKAPINVVGIVPATENMPGGRAIKPGDILTGASGKTVEVINTDAEGRLILGDGLWYAQQLGATHLVDVATLTGACMVALGRAASGLFGQPDTWVAVLQRLGTRTGDHAWPMPLYEEYSDQLKSEIADLLNTGGRPAGACTAAMFLKEFSGGLPWAHLDIAGTAWADDAKPWQAKGATGVAVRLLAELAFTSQEWKQD
jgi:leucyl aminopeptidase